MKESVKVLNECVDLQLKKSNDYQNPKSNVVQAMHYRRGIDSIHDIIQGKVYRAQSLLEAEGNIPNFESLEDTYKDIINYCSFAVSWLRGKMEGQDPNRDIFNSKIEKHDSSKIEEKSFYIVCETKNPDQQCSNCNCWKSSRSFCS